MNPDKLSLFLGCIIPNRYPGIEKATKLCLDKLEIDWIDLPNASCCPAPGVFRSFDMNTWLAIAGRNISISEELERDILTICNGCYGSLADANNKLINSEKLKEETNNHLKQINKEFRGTIKIRHIIEYLYREFGPEDISERVEYPLNFNVALHYGCHLVKPSGERNLGNVERPEFFDELIESTGASSLDYPDKMECCGAGGGVRSALHDKALEITNHKLSQIKNRGVDCIVNACPFCHMQLDSGQAELREKFGVDYEIPVLHYTQLLGLAFGYTPAELGINLNYIKNQTFLDKLEQIVTKQ
ncbi:CoB/CoM heterodisulfide reductase, subunit B [Methanohalobium evestigatum Z-7303]|uniref:CoB/CoM heterodisulfide reductase, subunit B n=1 Tax=Methanohalobium evestigatum (strain ATCC BAA-1072 / DSM 3721 / NBRC 107634 / OCM 161 / Z-7303) TaxID=644295 RepID=D7E9Q3_METEZ|nr:CoB--CoM heterodisulfide reductase subunit B [Methanohalobium evestigatum]ADI74325.1 CoB/CoM heterodisulfide reductase, subunit B [Methanohalobium evestigatum Z-7303]